MTPTSIGGEKQAGISGGSQSPADIASGRIAEVRSRSMSCNCMTRTSQQECRGILELKNLVYMSVLPIQQYEIRFQIQLASLQRQDCSQRHTFCCQFIIPSILLRQHCTHARCRCCHHDQKYFADQPIIYYLTYKKHCSNRDSQ